MSPAQVQSMVINFQERKLKNDSVRLERFIDRFQRLMYDARIEGVEFTLDKAGQFIEVNTGAVAGVMQVRGGLNISVS